MNIDDHQKQESRSFFLLLCWRYFNIDFIEIKEKRNEVRQFQLIIEIVFCID